MKPTRPVHVVAGAHTPFIGKFHPDFIWKKHPDFGKRENPTIEDDVHKPALAALESIGADPAQVDGGVVGNFVGECFVNQGHLGSMLAGAHPGFANKPFSRVEGACASGSLAMLDAIRMIDSGLDVVIVVGAEVQTTVNAKEGADYLARASHYAKERSIDPFTFPCMFARRMKAYCDAHGTNPGDLAPVVAKAYANAAKNPFAHMREVAMSVEKAQSASDSNPNFLENQEYNEFLKISDCSQVSDGGSAIVLASEKGLERLGVETASTTQIIAYGHATGALGEVDDLLSLQVTTAAAQQAYLSAGWNATDVQVAEVHDCFSIAEVLMYEALGFCGKGEGVAFGADGNTKLDGKIPVNTGGGLMAFGHPVGATGVKQIFEIHRQMKGQAGDYQLAEKPNRGIAANMGGDDRTSVVTLLENRG